MVISALDIPSFKLKPHFHDAIAFIQNGLQAGNVLLHCASGVSRSGTLAVAYLMKTRKLSFEAAFDQVKQARDINPNYGFQKQLKQFEKELKASDIVE